MTRDYDSRLLESVAVRRRRLRDAVMFGRHRTRRTVEEHLNRIAAGLCVAAVACSGCVGWSLVRSQLRAQRTQADQARQPSVPPANPDSGPQVPIPASWVGVGVAAPMLRAALDRARVPATLYVLPGQPRPAPARTSSYYLLVKGRTQYDVGIVEGGQGRTGPGFASEDEACRWLYGELVLKETPPIRLGDQDERQAARLTATLIQDAKDKIVKNTGIPVAYLLEPGRLVDAFGQESGSALFPDGTPFSRRGEPKSVRATVDPAVPAGYSRYHVVKPLALSASIVAAADGTAAGGIRLTIDPALLPTPPALPTIRWLLRNGYLSRIAVRTVPG